MARDALCLYVYKQQTFHAKLIASSPCSNKTDAGSLVPTDDKSGKMTSKKEESDALHRTLNYLAIIIDIAA